MPRQYTVATPSIAPRSAQSGLFNQSLSVRVNLRVSGGICKASWRLAVQPCLPNGVAYSRQRATRCFAHSLGPWHHGSGRRMAPNNSFKPNLLRSSKSVAEKACHAFASTTQVGLTQALGCAREFDRFSATETSQLPFCSFARSRAAFDLSRVAPKQSDLLIRLRSYPNRRRVGPRAFFSLRSAACGLDTG